MEKYSIEPYNDNDEVSDFRKEEAYMRAKKKVDSLMGFYWHFAVYIVVNIFLIILIGNRESSDFIYPVLATFLSYPYLFVYKQVYLL